MAPIQQSTLPNGLRVAVHPDGSTPLVGVSLTYDVGSRVEQPGRSGFAHLFEHLMFQGSAHVPCGDFVQQVQGWGGEVNGVTGVERTTYYHSLPAHRLALGLWLEADRMRSLNLSSASFENQQQTVLEEYRERVEQAAYGRAHGRITEMSYDSYGYGHPVIGYREDIEQATLESIARFHRTWYGPDNAVLAITGDLDPGEAIDWVEQLFSGVQPGEERPPLAFEQTPRMLPVTERMRDPQARLPAVFVNHPSVPYGDPDFFVYEVLETMLFRGASSRLQRKLVTERGTALNLRGGYEAHRGPSLFSLFAVLPEGSDPSAAVAAYEAELELLTKEAVTEGELEKVRNQLAASRLFGQQSLISRANSLARSVLFHNDAHFEERYMERVFRVEPEDILRVARRDFDPNAAVVLEVMAS